MYRLAILGLLALAQGVRLNLTHDVTFEDDAAAEAGAGATVEVDGGDITINADED